MDGKIIKDAKIIGMGEFLLDFFVAWPRACLIEFISHRSCESYVDLVFEEYIIGRRNGTRRAPIRLTSIRSLGKYFPRAKSNCPFFLCPKE